MQANFEKIEEDYLKQIKQLQSALEDMQRNFSIKISELKETIIEKDRIIKQKDMDLQKLYESNKNYDGLNSRELNELKKILIQKDNIIKEKDFENKKLQQKFRDMENMYSKQLTQLNELIIKKETIIKEKDGNVKQLQTNIKNMESDYTNKLTELNDMLTDKEKAIREKDDNINGMMNQLRAKPKTEIVEVKQKSFTNIVVEARDTMEILALTKEELVPQTINELFIAGFKRP